MSKTRYNNYEDLHEDYSKRNSHFAHKEAFMHQSTSQQIYQEYIGEYSGNQDEAFYQFKPKEDERNQLPIKQVKYVKPSQQLLPKGWFKAFIVWGILFFMTLMMVYFLIPNHYVNYIVVEGNQVTDSAAIIQASGIEFWNKYGEVKANQKKIAAEIIKAYPRVSNVEINRYQNYGIKVEVEEHVVVAKLNLNGRLVPVLDNGEKVLDNDTIQQQFNLGKYPEIVLLKPDDAVEVTQVLKETPQHILEQIDKIQYNKKETHENTIELWMKDGNVVKAILPTFNQKIIYYPKMLEELSGKKGTINLEVGAYFSPTQADVVPIKLQSGH